MASEGFSSHTLYAQLLSTAQTHEHESELYELAQLAGVTMDPEVFKIILDLLEMKCSPKTIADVIHSMVKHKAPETDEFHDIGQGEPAHHSTTHSRNVSSHGHGHSSHSPLRAPPPTSASKSHVGGGNRSNTSSDQSRFSHVTMRSNTGEQHSRSSGSRSMSSANASSSRLTNSSLHDSSSSYLSRGERKGRPK